METIVLFVESFVGVPIDVRRFSIGWNILGTGVIVGGGGILRALCRVGAHAIGDFADAGGAGDGFNLFLRGGVDIR